MTPWAKVIIPWMANLPSMPPLPHHHWCLMTINTNLNCPLFLILSGPMRNPELQFIPFPPDSNAYTSLYIPPLWPHLPLFPKTLETFPPCPPHMLHDQSSCSALTKIQLSLGDTASFTALSGGISFRLSSCVPLYLNVGFSVSYCCSDKLPQT